MGRIPMCMAFNLEYGNQLSLELQQRFALPRWAQCSSVVLLIKVIYNGCYNGYLGDTSELIMHPTVRSLTIVGGESVLIPYPGQSWKGSSLPNPLLARVLQHFPALESLELRRISDVSKYKLAAISKYSPRLVKVVFDSCHAAKKWSRDEPLDLPAERFCYAAKWNPLDEPLDLSGVHFELPHHLRHLSILNYSGALRFSGIPFEKAPPTLEVIHFAEGRESIPQGAREWFEQNIQLVQQQRSENFQITYS